MNVNLVTLFSVDEMVKLFISIYAQLMGAKVFERVFSAKTIKAIRGYMVTLKEYATDFEHFSWDVNPTEFWETIETEMKENGDMEWVDGFSEWKNTDCLCKAYQRIRDLVFDDSSITDKYIEL